MNQCANMPTGGNPSLAIGTLAYWHIIHCILTFFKVA